MRAVNADRELLEQAGYYIVDAARTRRVRQALDLASRPFQRFRTFWKEGENGFVYMYDSENINEFDGQLDEFDGPFVGGLTELIGRYMMMAETPDLTESETRLFDQLRTADLAFGLMEHEAGLQQAEGASSRALLARLRTRMLPCPVPKDNPNCPVCHDPMSEIDGDSHRAMKLPCPHIVGRDCMETWVGGWVPGYPFYCCPLCRESFDMLTGLEQADGIDLLNRAGLPAAGFWLRVVSLAWNEGEE
jgi:hypothetical protein